MPLSCLASVREPPFRSFGNEGRRVASLIVNLILILHSVSAQYTFLALLFDGRKQMFYKELKIFNMRQVANIIELNKSGIGYLIGG